MRWASSSAYATAPASASFWRSLAPLELGMSAPAGKARGCHIVCQRAAAQQNKVHASSPRSRALQPRTVVEEERGGLKPCPRQERQIKHRPLAAPAPLLWRQKERRAHGGEVVIAARQHENRRTSDSARVLNLILRAFGSASCARRSSAQRSHWRRHSQEESPSLFAAGRRKSTTQCDVSER